MSSPNGQLFAGHYQIKKMKEHYSSRVNKYKSNLPGNNEWISFYDIGSLVTKEEYLYTENEFIKLFMNLSISLSISHYMITDLENYNNLNYHDGDKIQCTDIEPLIRDILREKLWCKLRQISWNFILDMITICVFRRV